MPRPFLKWAGGKTQLLKYIDKLVPEKFNTFYEPFVGAGALFFSLQAGESVINDINGDLINVYRVVQQNVTGLIKVLKTYETASNEKDYYKIRSINPLELTALEAAARFIYLNKNCYNGVYRVNKKNQFNVPFAYPKNPKICDEYTLKMASKQLKDTKILSSEFYKVTEDAKEGDLVYFDPPYIKVSSDSFVDYSKDGFGTKDHEKLSQVFKELSGRGVHCILSNSDTELSRSLYEGYEITDVTSRRSINSNGKGRGKVGELLINGNKGETNNA